MFELIDMKCSGLFEGGRRVNCFRLILFIEESVCEYRPLKASLPANRYHRIMEGIVDLISG